MLIQINKYTQQENREQKIISQNMLTNDIIEDKQYKNLHFYLFLNLLKRP